MENNERIVNKINKLLVMAMRGTENEQKIALVKAQKMMLDYHIFEGDLNDHNKKVISIKINEMNCYSAWTMELSEVISSNFRCMCAYYTVKNVKGKIIQCTVYGLSEDAEICNSVLMSAYSIIEKGSKSIVNFYYRTNKSTKGVKEAYCRGFIKGLKEGYYQQVLGNEKYALVVVVPEEVTQYLEHFESKKFLTRKVKDNKNEMAKNIGYQDGLDFVLGSNKTREITNKMYLKNSRTGS